MAGGLQGDGKRGVRQRIVGSKRGEGKSSPDGLLQMAGITQSSHQPVMRLMRMLIYGDGRAESTRGLLRPAGGEQIEAVVAELFGSGGLRVH